MIKLEYLHKETRSTHSDISSQLALEVVQMENCKPHFQLCTCKGKNYERLEFLWSKFKVAKQPKKVPPIQRFSLL